MAKPLLGALLLAWAASYAGARSIGVIIGIPVFPQDPNTEPVAFADHDARLFQQKIAAKFDLQFVVRKDEGLFAAQSALNRGLLSARKGDTVFLFLSTRGIARPGSIDGYFGAADFVAQKESSAGVRISYLEQLIAESKADRVIIFADLCRQPAQPVPDNRINIRLSELGARASGKLVAGILATGPRQFSTEDGALPGPNEKGFGVFGYHLANLGAQAGGGAGLQQLLGQLVKGMPEKWLKVQRPRPFGKADAPAPPLWSMTVPPLLPFRPMRYGALLAALEWDPAAVWLQGQAAEGRLAELDRQLDQPKAIADPRGVAAAIRDLSPRVAAEAWEQLRIKAVSALAGEGQVCVSRYGMQDLLPADPLRVSDAQFLRCADAFAAAGLLVPDDAAWQPYRAMLRVRELLCRARPNLPNSFDLLTEANAHAEFNIPEVDNSLGIYWLDSGRPGRYAQAETFFKRAKQATPAWLYPRHNLALTYAEQGDIRSAEREYSEALTISPVQPYVYYNYGLILERLNRPADARKQFQKAMDEYEASIRLFKRRAAEWLSTHPDEAALTLRRADVFHAAEAEVQNAWGAHLEGKRDLAGAAKRYRVATGLDPVLCPPAANLARVELELGRPQSAIDALKDVASCGGLPQAHIVRGEAYRQLRLMDESQAEYAAALQQQPGHIPALMGLAAVEDVRGRSEQAMTWLEQAVNLLGAGTSLPSSAPGQSLFVALANRYRAAGNAESCRESYRLAETASERKLRRGELRKAARSCGYR